MDNYNKAKEYAKDYERLCDIHDIVLSNTREMNDPDLAGFLKKIERILLQKISEKQSLVDYYYKKHLKQ